MLHPSNKIESTNKNKLSKTAGGLGFVELFRLDYKQNALHNLARWYALNYAWN